MKKILLFFMLLIPSLCFAASGVLTAKGDAQDLSINKGERWEVSCDQRKDQITFNNWSNGKVITCKIRGNMTHNGALNYDVYVGEKSVCSAWIYVNNDGDKIKDLYIQLWKHTIRFE